MTTIYSCFTCWKKDWSKKIVVEAKGNQIKRFASKIRKIVGRQFMYELNLTTEKPDYFIDDKNGLISY